MAPVHSKPWIIAVDPGTVNGGVCFLNRFTLEVKLLSINFMLRPNPAKGNKLEKVKYEERHLFVRVMGFVEDFKSMFEEGHLVLVEKQMKRPHLLFAATLIMCVRMRFGHLGLKAYSITQKTVRAFFGTRAKDYGVRKNLSGITAIPFLGPAADAECQAKFWKGDRADKLVHSKTGRGAHVDPQEAMEIAIVGFHLEAQIMKLDAQGYTFEKRQSKAVEFPVRAVYIPRLFMEVGMADVLARRKRLRDAKKECAEEPDVEFVLLDDSDVEIEDTREPKAKKARAPPKERTRGKKRKHEGEEEEDATRPKKKRSKETKKRAKKELVELREEGDDEYVPKHKRKRESKKPKHEKKEREPKRRKRDSTKDDAKKEKARKSPAAPEETPIDVDYLDEERADAAQRKTEDEALEWMDTVVL